MMRKVSRIIVGSLVVLAVSLATTCGGDEGPARQADQTATPGTGSPVPLATSVLAATPTPELPSGSMDIGSGSVWEPLLDEATLARLHECGGDRPSECVTAIMQSSGASSQAIEFFKMTRWFLSDFQEMGTVDLGRIVDPWRANDNVQYAFLNGSPLVVYPEEEVRPAAIELDPNYDALVPSFPNLSLWPGDSVFEVLGVSEQGGQRFVLEFSLVDGCHACGTGHFARVAFDFALDGTYGGVSSRPLGLCWNKGPDVTPIAASVPTCPPAADRPG